MSKDEAIGQLRVSIVHSISSKCRRFRSKFYNWKHLAWIILFIASINVICIGGKRRAFGIFVAALKVSFNQTSMTELNWVGDSYAALGFFLMPFVTTVIIRFCKPYRLVMFAAGFTIFVSCMTSAIVPSPAYLFLTHTLLHGIGSTLILCATSLIAGDYFDKNHRFHVFATTFVSGGPYGVLLFGPLFSYWIQKYDWRVAFELSGFLFLFVSWFGAVVFLPKSCLAYYKYEQEADEFVHCTKELNGTINPSTSCTSKENGQLNVLKPNPVDSNNVEDNDYVNVNNTTTSTTTTTATTNNNWAFCSIDHIKNNPQIFVWAGERLIHNLVVYGLLMNLTSYVNQAVEYQLVLGAQVNLYFGLGESAVFTIGAIVGDKIRGHLPLVYLIGATLGAVFLLILQTTYTDLNVVYVLAGFTGATVGVGNTFLYATSEEVMLIDGSIAFPMTKMVAGIGMLLAPIFSGMIIDDFGYKGFFVSMAVLISIRVLLLAVICHILNKKKKKDVVDHFQSITTGHCCKAGQKIEIKAMKQDFASNGVAMVTRNSNNPKSDVWYNTNDEKIP